MLNLLVIDSGTKLPTPYNVPQLETSSAWEQVVSFLSGYPRTSAGCQYFSTLSQLLLARLRGVLLQRPFIRIWQLESSMGSSQLQRKQ